jgi:hypothetical protein
MPARLQGDGQPVSLGTLFGCVREEDVHLRA